MNIELTKNTITRLRALQAAIERSKEKVGLNIILDMKDNLEKEVKKYERATNPFGNLPEGFEIRFVENQFMEEGSAILMVHPNNIPGKG